MIYGNVFLFISSIVLGWILTRLTIVLALHWGIKDVPNHRSLHAIPTPRGGGLSIVFTSLAAALALSLINTEFLDLLWPLILGGIIVGVTGFIDDRKGLSPKLRLFLQVTAVSILIFSKFEFLNQELFPGFPESSWFNAIVLVLFMIWMTNLFNFMDGIDGLAGGQAVSFGLISSVVLIGVSAAPLVSILGLVLSGSALGFLILNWSPAKVFMGDVGSGFIGFWIAGLSLIGFTDFGLSLNLFLIPMAVFIVDATYTLIKRTIRGARITEGHREHAYQILVRQGLEHATVTRAVLLFNFLILGPLTYYIVAQDLRSFFVILVLFGLMSLVPTYLGAGKKEKA
jgi:Fuc2NAc and GlcNAc transferase